MESRVSCISSSWRVISKAHAQAPPTGSDAEGFENKTHQILQQALQEIPAFHRHLRAMDAQCDSEKLRGGFNNRWKWPGRVRLRGMGVWGPGGVLFKKEKKWVHICAQSQTWEGVWCNQKAHLEQLLSITRLSWSWRPVRMTFHLTQVTKQ